MTELVISCLSPHDFPDVAVCDGSCGGGGGCPCLLHAGLCCPDDPLDTIMNNPDLFNDDLPEDVFIAAALPPPHRGVLPTGGGKEVLDVDAADDVGCRDGAACSDGAPRLPPAVHAALSDSSWTTTSSLETESPPPPVSRLVVPRKKRDTSVKRRKRLWSLDMPSVPASRDSASGGDGDQDGRRSVDGGVRPRLLGARPRNTRTQQRACRHCDSTETPQWRAGPDGPGTLCNACGIRYTMNKLLPEYRPSTSPSFRSDKHSNRHRKVVKLRETKQVLKEKNVNMLPAPNYGDFMDVCKYISTGQSHPKTI
ncbi:hypothetical protein PAHAL_1G020500 [Panicum hallii]|jgi:hypothetical protein|uniref:GATA-type domain-containing protein n=1 Tax=Panicum hallii TaxID=206008 RepID=A0A2T8KTM5_9POAL|nr:uncharacterized protein LOC112883918 [Panicum hallii]PVH65537.1 hypothetical protein PAHAL_1G020500 [Panicum hallii]